MMTKEIREYLTCGIIPFWKALRDDEHGGYYGGWAMIFPWIKRRRRAVF